MVEFQITGVGEVEFALQRIEVHGGTGDGLQAEGGAGQVDVLRDIAGIHGSEFVVGSTVGVLGADEDERDGSRLGKSLTAGNGLKQVLVGDFGQRVGLGVVEADTILGAYIHLDVLHIDGRRSGDFASLLVADTAGGPEQGGKGLQVDLLVAVLALRTALLQGIAQCHGQFVDFRLWQADDILGLHAAHRHEGEREKNHFLHCVVV